MKPFGRIIAVAGCLLLAGLCARAEEERAMGPYQGSAQFERMKHLVGVWVSTASASKPGEKTFVEYQVTAGGSAVLEKLFSGTPKEMTSLYYDRGGILSMTHYCMLRNQPNLKVNASDNAKLDFLFVDSPGIDPARDPHMHALSLTWKDKDHITQQWTMYENGREKSSMIIPLARVR